MCSTCGCSDHQSVEAHHHGDGDEHHHHPSISEAAHSRAPSVVRLEHDVLARNNQLAEHNRRWLAARGILALNLMSSPGAGKTTLIERMLRELGAEACFSVIEGDQATSLDAERIRATGCRAVQINTGAGCHLDAAMVGHALEQLDPPAGSVLLIENVGNLVCPALFDLGERAKVVLCSVAEGEDKPLKYPFMFRACSLMLLNKIDLLPHLRFDVNRCLEFARRVQPELEVVQVSAYRGDGLDRFYGWMIEQLAQARHAHEPRSGV